jgi:hypothetical protein
MKSPTVKSLTVVVAPARGDDFRKGAEHHERGRERALDPIIVDRKILITCSLFGPWQEAPLILRNHGRRAAA